MEFERVAARPPAGVNWVGVAEGYLAGLMENARGSGVPSRLVPYTLTTSYLNLLPLRANRECE